MTEYNFPEEVPLVYYTGRSRVVVGKAKVTKCIKGVKFDAVILDEMNDFVSDLGLNFGHFAPGEFSLGTVLNEAGMREWTHHISIDDQGIRRKKY